MHCLAQVMCHKRMQMLLHALIMHIDLLHIMQTMDKMTMIRCIQQAVRMIHV